MSSDVAVAVRGLSKAYRIHHADDDAKSTLAEAAVARLRRPWAARRSEEFWALQALDLDVYRGEILGIIGHNGAGKSTLLKILSRVTYPTAGRVDLFGRIGSLLEVGTGFHPELTGRENIFLNGTILGMRRREVARRFEEIVEFAGVEKFLDTPVKRYSSGMYVRLAFAVAAHLDTEILVVDEVLAVGDSAFQRKSLGKMGEAAGHGRTVLLVSHNLGIMTQLAHRCALLRGGRLHALGKPGEIVDQYLTMARPDVSDSAFTNARRPEPGLDRKISLIAGELQNASGVLSAGDALRIGLRVWVGHTLSSLRFTFIIHRIDGQPVGTSFLTVEAAREGTEQTVEADLGELRLAPGRYYLTVGVGNGDTPIGTRNHDAVTDVFHFEHAPPSSDGLPDVWYPGWGSTRLMPARLIE